MARTLTGGCDRTGVWDIVPPSGPRVMANQGAPGPGCARLGASVTTPLKDSVPGELEFIGRDQPADEVLDGLRDHEVHGEATLIGSAT